MDTVGTVYTGRRVFLDRSENTLKTAKCSTVDVTSIRSMSIFPYVHDDGGGIVGYYSSNGIVGSG